MCVGFLAGITYLHYPVLMSPKKDETAVHCCDPELSVLVTLISANVFHLASALKSISRLELVNQRARHSSYKHMLYNNNYNNNINNNNNNNNNNLIIKISERSFTQRFDDSMSSFSSEKRIKFTTIYTVQGDKT